MGHKNSISVAYLSETSQLSSPTDASATFWVVLHAGVTVQVSSLSKDMEGRKDKKKYDDSTKMEKERRLEKV